MYWLDNSTGVTTPPTIPPVQSPVRRYFTEGGQGLSPSTPGGEWFNMVTDELLALLALANITPDKTDHSQIAKAIQTIAFSAYPVGAPIPWPGTVPPVGFLAMNGQSFDKNSYPKLAKAYPSGVLPDLRGEFIRGWDNSRGVDSGRGILSAQSHAMQNITGSIFGYGATSNSAPFTTGTGAFFAGPMNKSIIFATEGVANQRSDSMMFDASRVVSTANEFRPRSLAFNYITQGL